MIEIAKQFGHSLDNDAFDQTKKLLSPDCKYSIGEEVLIGPENICASYEQNMLDGRKKLDKLEWGKSRIEPISTTEFFVHFTDYLTHKDQKYTHRCKQKLTLNKSHAIISIEHIHDQDEQDRLNAYYSSVGLK